MRIKEDEQKMEILVPRSINKNWDRQVESLFQVKPLKSFSEESIQFIKTLSKELLREKNIKIIRN